MLLQNKRDKVELSYWRCPRQSAVKTKAIRFDMDISKLQTPLNAPDTQTRGKEMEITLREKVTQGKQGRPYETEAFNWGRERKLFVYACKS
jgi:hypothetical protein